MSSITIPSFPNTTFPSMGDLLIPTTSLYSIKQCIRGDTIIPFPVLPTVPSPLEASLPTINVPTLESFSASAGIHSGMIPSIIVSALTPIESLLGPLLDLIPDVPNIPFQFADVLPPYDPAKLILSLQDFNIYTIPNIPTLWPTLNIPDLQVFSAAQVALNELNENAVLFLASSVDIVVGVIEDIIESSLPALMIPKIPSLDDLLGLLPEHPTIDDLINITIPPFPKLSASTPIYPNIGIPDQEFTVGLQMMKSEMVSYILNIITDFIANLPIIGGLLKLPTLEDIFGAIIMPTIEIIEC